MHLIANGISDRPLPKAVLAFDHTAAAVAPQPVMLGNAGEYLRHYPWDVVSGM